MAADCFAERTYVSGRFRMIRGNTEITGKPVFQTIRLLTIFKKLHILGEAACSRGQCPTVSRFRYAFL